MSPHNEGIGGDDHAGSAHLQFGEAVVWVAEQTGVAGASQLKRHRCRQDRLLSNQTPGTPCC